MELEDHNGQLLGIHGPCYMCKIDLKLEEQRVDITIEYTDDEARKLLGLSWHQVEVIKARAVTRGLARRESTTTNYLGIDKKQFRSVHRYVTNLYDLEGGRVLDVVEGRTENDCEQASIDGGTT